MNFEIIYGLILILCGLLVLGISRSAERHHRRMSRMHRQQAARHEDFIQSIQSIR